jgi:hypothetical protein
MTKSKAYSKATPPIAHFKAFHLRDAHILQKSRSHLKILGAATVILNNFHTEESQILGATFQNLEALATKLSGFKHPYPASTFKIVCQCSKLT